MFINNRVASEMGKDEYGEPLHYDPTFNGPIHNRSCTDVFWLILFIVFLGGWGYVGYYAISQGNIEKLLAPIDTVGRRCGLDSGVENKPYLVFFNIGKCLRPDTPLVGCPTPQVCTQSCPTETRPIEVELRINPGSLQTLKEHMICNDQVDIASISTAQQALDYISEDKCASYVLKSTPVLSRCIGDLSTIQCKDTSANSPWSQRQPITDETCVRNPKEKQKDLLQSASALDSYVGWIAASWVTYFTNNERDVQILSTQIVQDLVQSRYYLLGALFAVVLLCFIYILLLRWVVGPLVWISIVGLLALLGFCLYLCYKQYAYFKANPNQLYQTTNLKGYTQSIFAKHETWLVIMIAVAVLLVVLLLIVVFLRKRISVAIALIKEGSKAVIDIKSTILFPIFPWIFQLAVIAYGCVVLVCLWSLGESVFRTANMLNDTNCNCVNNIYTNDSQVCSPLNFVANCHDIRNPVKPCEYATCHFTGFDNPTSTIYLQLVNLLGFFWVMFFISGVADMMLASTFATWYWTFKKRDLPFFTLTAGIWRTVRYHLGTVAFGSLIIAIVRVIRVILEYVDHKLKKFDNAFTRALLCCCKCLFWCLENFLKFINKNAYIMCAVHGKNFCSSARDAFSLLMRNIVRVVVLDKVTDFIFFLSKLLISIGVGIGVYYLLQWKFVYEVTQGAPLHYNYIPAIILSISTYLISSIFFKVYAMAVDTLFLCFLEDQERNDGSPEKPFFMSKNLRKILGKTNKRSPERRPTK